ncbi:hypothetical protein J4208_01545 [Candidatus Woesearchaeota archaeon]|nr:hypothetical protein [Candidatus Woesearchaeota archaeon]
MVYLKTRLVDVINQGGIALTAEHQERLEAANGLRDRLANFFASLYDTTIPKPPVKYLTLNDFVDDARRTTFLRTTLGGSVTPYFMEELGGMCDKDGKAIRLNPYRNSKMDGEVIAHELGHATLHHATPPFESTGNQIGLLREAGDYHEAIAQRFAIDALPFLREIGEVGSLMHFFMKLGNKLSSRGRTIAALMGKQGVTMKELLTQPHEMLKRHEQYFAAYSL